jgi:hypothetical protein
LKYVLVIRVILRFVVKGARKEFPRYPLKWESYLISVLSDSIVAMPSALRAIQEIISDEN